MIKNFLILAVLFVALSSPAYAQTEVTIGDLGADASPSGTDIVETEKDPGGTPSSKKVTLTNLVRKAHGLSDGYLQIESGVLNSKSVAQMQAGLSIDDLIALTGVTGGVAVLGEFTGETITDDRTIKQALQLLETAVEGKAAADHDHDSDYEPVQSAASEAEMEAGTEVGIRSMSPLRVAQAIAALAPEGSSGDDLGDAAAADIVALFGGGECSGYLKSDGGCDTPSGAEHDAVSLSTALGTNLLGLTGQEITIDNQSANKIFAGPASGDPGAPAFRDMVANDLPDLSSVYSVANHDHDSDYAAADHDHDSDYEPIMTAATENEMAAGTEAGLRSMSPLRVAQAISSLAGTSGWDATVRTSAPGSPTTGWVYLADGDDWDPLSRGTAAPYYVMRLADGYVALFDLEGNWIYNGIMPVAASASSGDYSGRTVSKVAGATLAFGDAVYLMANGKVGKANAGSADTMPCFGMVAVGGEEDATVTILLDGYITSSSWSWPNVGKVLYASGSAGGFAQSAPSGSGNLVQVVGIADAATRIYLSPSFNMVEVE